ncbi:MAG: hypothetical protein WC815_16895 [Vicinamibacterales bacterium]
MAKLKKWQFVGLLLLVALLWAVIDILERLQDGPTEAGHAEVVWVDAKTRCSAVRIADTILLTADTAHCQLEEKNAVKDDKGGFAALETLIGNNAAAGVSIWKMKLDPTAPAGMSVWPDASAVSAGTTMRLVGYGRPPSSAGVRKAAVGALTAACSPTDGCSQQPAWTANILLGRACGHDSGGGLFTTDRSGSAKLAGLHIGPAPNAGLDRECCVDKTRFVLLDLTLEKWICDQLKAAGISHAACEL